MLFMYIATHTPDKCLLGKPQESLRVHSELKEGFKREGVKVSGAYVSTPEHTVFYVLEADNMEALSRALTPATRMGCARLIPVTEQKMLVG